MMIVMITTILHNYNIISTYTHIFNQ